MPAGIENSPMPIMHASQLAADVVVVGDAPLACQEDSREVQRVGDVVECALLEDVEEGRATEPDHDREGARGLERRLRLFENHQEHPEGREVMLHFQDPEGPEDAEDGAVELDPNGAQRDLDVERRDRREVNQALVVQKKTCPSVEHDGDNVG